MRAFGYLYNSEKLFELSECTLECTLKEIESLIILLSKFKNKVEAGIADGIWSNDDNVIVHEHFFHQTEKSKSDFIIVTRINEETNQGSKTDNQSD